MTHKLYRVNWDNGANASGTFDNVFATEAEAEQFGANWQFDMTSVDDDNERDADYEYEVIEEECAGCEQCCTDTCTGCAYCYEDNSPRAMGWVDDKGRP